MPTQTLDRSAQVATWGPFAVNTAPGIGQTFTALSGGLSKVEFFADWNSGAGPVDYRIYLVSNDGAGGAFSPGTVLARSEVRSLAPDTGSNVTLMSADFSAVSLVAGQRYAVLIDASPSARSDNAKYDLYLSRGGAGYGTDYTGGTAIFFAGASENFFSANWEAVPEFDLSFRLTFGSNAAPVNSVPAAGLFMNEDATLNLSGVSVSDLDGDALVTTVGVSAGALSGGSVPNGAAVTVIGTGFLRLAGSAQQIAASLAGVRYAPLRDFAGTANLTLITSDGSLTDTDTAVIRVLPVNDAPAAAADAAAVLSFGSVNGDVRANDSDVETARSGLTIRSFGGAGGVAGPGGNVAGRLGSLAMAATGVFIYSANAAGGLLAGDTASDIFTYVIGDTDGGAAQSTLTVTVTGRSAGGAGADVITGNASANQLSGGFGDDVLSGGFGADVLYGNQDADVLYGNQDGDVLYGGQGNDTLYGGQGDDVLAGGLGGDTLFGNLGADTFLYLSVGDSPAAGPDTLADFVSGQDRIDLRRVRPGTAGDSFSLSNSGGVTTLAVDLGGDGGIDLRVLIIGTAAIGDVIWT